MSVAEQQLDLDLFEQLNTRDPKPGWAQRAHLVRRRFPSLERLNTAAALREDWDMFATVMRDILKVGQEPPGRSGPRPLDYEQGEYELRQMLGADFTILAFPEAFRILAGDRSRSHLARKTGLERTKVHRLLAGQEPTADEIEAVAAAFGKHPSYFAEWRVAFVAAVVAERLQGAPESSIGLYRRIEGQHRNGGR